MNKNLIENEDFQTVTPSENGLFTIATLNTNSPSNSGLLKDFQNVDDIPEIPISTNSCFDLNNLPKTETLSELLNDLCELMIRFDGCVKDYQKADYEHLIKVITNSSINLYDKIKSLEDSTIGDIDTHLGINRINGSSTKFLNEQGNMVEVQGGSGGTTNYSDLTNKPSINNVELSGNKTSAQLGLQPTGDYATNTDLANKVDKEAGKSLIADTEITRLATVTNQTQSDVDTYLGIDRPDGATDKFLNQKGEMVEITIEPVDINNVISKTYVELYSMVSDASLSVGQKYIISDYQTTYVIPNTSFLNECQIEPLIVTAVAVDKLANMCYSALFPQDIVFYEIENKTNIVPGCTKGYILKRIDTLRNNNIDFDWRNIKYRRWVVNVNNAWVSGDEYVLGDLVHFSNEIYVCISLNGAWTDINNNFESTGIYNGEYVSLNNSGLSIYINNNLVLIPAGTQYKDMTMFNDINNIN